MRQFKSDPEWMVLVINQPSIDWLITIVFVVYKAYIIMIMFELQYAFHLFDWLLKTLWCLKTAIRTILTQTLVNTAFAFNFSFLDIGIDLNGTPRAK